MGRRKIEIEPIKHERNRSVTFLKRKAGLFKKAYELGVLCSVDIVVIVFDHKAGQEEKLHEYCSSNSRSIVQRFQNFDGEREVKTPNDFNGNAANDGGDDDDEAIDADGDEEPEETASVPPPPPRAAAVPSTRTTSQSRTDKRQSSPPLRTSPSPPPMTSNSQRTRASAPTKRARLASSSNESSASYAARVDYDHTAASYRPIAPAPAPHQYPPQPSPLYSGAQYYEPEDEPGFPPDVMHAGRSNYDPLSGTRNWAPHTPLGLGNSNQFGMGMYSQQEEFDWPVHQSQTARRPSQRTAQEVWLEYLALTSQEDGRHDIDNLSLPPLDPSIRTGALPAISRHGLDALWDRHNEENTRRGGRRSR